jgi:hypothetical protein
MSQVLVPTSDVAKSNIRYSSGTAAFSLLNTGTTSGYIYGPDASETYDSGYATMHITDPTGTPGDGDVVLSGYIKSSSSGKGSVALALYQGTTLIATVTFSSPTTSFANRTYTLTAAEKAAITNWPDLRIKVTVMHSYYKSGDSNIMYDTYCAYCQLSVPDAAVGGGPEICLEMGCAA